MASISMNPYAYDPATYRMLNTLHHGHQLALVKGVVVALAILAVGLFTMAMPAMRPASNGAMNVVSEANDKAANAAFQAEEP